MTGAVDAENRRVRRIWETYAPRYDAGMATVERWLFANGRDWVCGQARGDVLEIAVGSGLNLSHYPDGVRLTGIEYSPAMLGLARARAARLGVAADLREGDAQALEFTDGTFDTVVCTLALCSIPDDARAVAEVRRVLRPRGRFLLLEHVRSPLLPIRAIERLLDPLSVRLAADHLVREPLDHLRAEGFTVERLERSRLGLVELVAARSPA